MMKRTASLALILGLSLVVAGCGGSPSSDPEPAPAAGNTEGDNANTKEETKPSLRMIMQYSLFDPNKEYTGNYIKEKTGYNMQYEMLPAENADEKLNLLMASKESFDLMKLSSAQFYNLATAGALEPIDELLAEHGNYINQAIKPESWGSATIDDKIYALPETGAGVSIGEELVVRQDWLDELGLSIPTTTDELYTVLKTIKEKKKIIPLTGSRDSIYGDIAAAFGVLTDWKEVNGKLVHKAEQPEMKEFLAYMNKLYSEGLVDTEMPLNTASKAIEKFSSGQAAVYKLAWWNAGSTISALNKNTPDAAVSIIPYLKNKEGKAVVGAVANTTWFIAIPKASKHKEDAMKLLNAKLEPETFKGMAIGIEGVHHEVKDGKYYPILPKFNDDLSNASAFMTGVDEEHYPVYWQARVRKDPILQSYYENFQKNAEGIIVVDPMSLAPPIEAVSKNTLKLNKLLDDNVLKFIAGTEPLDAYDQFLAQWHAEGGADMVKAANEWYSSAK
ncbi:extracellular solute-binding protein [Paenibacillus nasutitermitis]|uniref:ABC transporter peptide-binding protein YtcQ n=1 Tax=Paenibacillus nasutitermitis TaxID=1652958 RepID=A0A916YSL8_9BACL|nr:extracellular solute-binding protein [Paenibacillus nasutitermitis]GGD59520.1 putative ABC transporter peptide-binding protein YtcQ [Paenibacillus nasutitermitis]